MRGTCAEDLDKMGLEIVSFTIREIRDKSEYIANMGKPDEPWSTCAWSVEAFLATRPA